MTDRKKPGPKPKRDRALTDTERSRERRKRLKEEGFKAFTVYLPPSIVTKMERFVQQTGETAKGFFEEMAKAFLDSYCDDDSIELYCERKERQRQAAEVERIVEEAFDLGEDEGLVGEDGFLYGMEQIINRRKQEAKQ